MRGLRLLGPVCLGHPRVRASLGSSVSAHSATWVSSSRRIGWCLPDEQTPDFLVVLVNVVRDDELALGDANPPCRIGGCDRNDSGDRFAIAGNDELCFLTG